MLSDSQSGFGFTGASRPGIAELLSRKAAAAPDSLARLSAALAPTFAELVPEIPTKADAETDGWEATTAEQRLVQRATLGSNFVEMAVVEQLGYRGYLERQLAYEELDDQPLETALREALPTLDLTPAQMIVLYFDNQEQPLLEFWIATMLRSLYSPRQLFERMVIFWSDHFSIDILSDFGILFKPFDDAEVARTHALGSFPAMLRASARSPAMLSYLTNDTNRKDHPNENYARELMELHTLGVDNGYTQQDVREVARCFTGWTFALDGGPAELGRFRFDPSLHDFGEKTVLGHTIPAGGGIEDGEAVLAILAGHRGTAEFISRKMLRYLWGYDPPQWRVERVADKYQQTGGDIREMVRLILNRRWMVQASPKMKRPYHLVMSALRALGGAVENPFFLLSELQQAGHLPFNWAPPNGYPDSRGYWSAFLLPRWGFGSRLFLPGGTSTEALAGFLNPQLRSALLTQRIDFLLSNQTMTQPTRGAVRRFLGAPPRTPERVAQALGLAIASPDFQEY